jgi:peptidoglycan hydrolase-like protein with peptidoglycan-binding domain
MYIAYAAVAFAETVSGGGYYIQQVITPLENTLQGNGYILQQSSQQDGGINTGSGYTVTGVYGGTSTVTVSTPTPASPPASSFSSRGGYFIFPAPTLNPTTTVVTKVATEKGTVTFTGSTCESRVTFTKPIDYGVLTNNSEDVKKLEIFLNTYEGEKLVVNGVYDIKDVEAVKRWQKKYRSFILDPMGLKQPTGTVYTLSQRQIERQTTAICGEPIAVTACPYFRNNASYGDRGETVKQVQTFLNFVQGEKLPISGVYGPLTRSAVKRFQLAYKKDFFSRLKAAFISGNWNKETRIKANTAIGCNVVN